LVKASQAQFLALTLRETLGFSRSRYYYWIKRPSSQRTASNRRLTEQILAIHHDSDFTYERSGITAELVDLGVLANHKHVSRLKCKRRSRDKL
jgi:putative transposase